MKNDFPISNRLLRTQGEGMPVKKKTARKTPAASDNYWETRQELEKKKIRLFDQVLYRDWCKACGICIAFCPKKVFGRDNEGKPVINNPDDCIGCRFCELHCPDFAITIQERYPDRRKKANGKKE